MYKIYNNYNKHAMDVWPADMLARMSVRYGQDRSLRKLADIIRRAGKAAATDVVADIPADTRRIIAGYALADKLAMDGLVTDLRAGGKSAAQMARAVDDDRRRCMAVIAAMSQAETVDTDYIMAPVILGAIADAMAVYTARLSAGDADAQDMIIRLARMASMYAADTSVMSHDEANDLRKIIDAAGVGDDLVTAEIDKIDNT